MDKLIEVLQYIIEKYKVSEEDFYTIQEALTNLESDGSSEFIYEESVEEPNTEEVPEE